MIAKSDVIILVVSASALAAGIYRWQSNIASYAPVQTTASAPATTTLNPNTQASAIIANSQQAGNNPSLTTTGTAINGNSGSTIAVNGSIAQPSSVGTTVQASSSTINNASTANVSVGNNNQDAGSTLTQVAEPLYGSYLVKSGDYLGKIAQTYGTTVSELRRINNISGSIIEIDQEILYPLPAN
ncbi:MAG: LysM peptidoglycan-binding domain-containing protein [Granulosicoccus sp.]